MPSDASFHRLSAIELLSAYKRKELSPVEVFDGLLSHIALWEPYLKALYAFDPDGARRAAKASAERWRRGEPIGLLDGVPVTIKEIIATRGVPSPLGTAASKLTPADEDAPPAARLREAGAIIFSKTAMPDYGMLSSGLSSFHGITRNPWHLDKNPGGSSAGAGAAAAAGYGPLHLGTDIGGSVRLPACWCGIVALKPSFGRVPIDSPYFGRVAGPMTRTVDDAALMMSVLSRPDGRDSTSLPPADIEWMALDGAVDGLRLGLMLDAGCGMKLDDEAREVIVACAKTFETAGAIITEVPGVLTQDLLDGLDNFWRARAWIDISTLAPEAREKVLPYILVWAERAANLTAAGAVRGFNGTMTIRHAAARLFTKVDFVLSPVAPAVSFPATAASPLDDPSRPLDHIGYTMPWNMSDQPAISINAGYSASGFPIGLQIVGARFDDLGVLRMARAFEAIRGPQRPWPEPPQIPDIL